MSFKIKSIGLALLGALLALTSCRDLTLDPVFYALSQEQPLGDDRGFPDGATVHRMVKITVGTDYYVAAAGRLYIRGTGTSDTWTVVDAPTGLANAMCNTLELFGGNLYAGFYNHSTGEGYGLYNAPLALPISWTLVADSDVQNTEITLLKDVAGLLFVGTNANGTNLNALYSGNGSAFDAVTWLTAPADDIGFIDVARATSGGSYWILVGASLYRNTAALPGGSFDVFTGGAGSPPVSPLSSPPASGGLFDDGTTLYVSAGNGRLYSTADGGANWARSVEILDEDTDYTVRFTSFAAPASDAGAVYVGTQGQGYYRILGGDVTGILTREPSYNITALYTGALNSFFYDSANSRLFFCANSSGLWRGTDFSGSAVAWTWRQE
jgi:hypothetical protein